jgi:hypothetical protein
MVVVATETRCLQVEGRFLLKVIVTLPDNNRRIYAPR